MHHAHAQQANVLFRQRQSEPTASARRSGARDVTPQVTFPAKLDSNGHGDIDDSDESFQTDSKLWCAW